jgi:SAM-dependent methyltransferase
MAVGRRPALARARREHGAERVVQLVYGYLYGDPDLHTHIRYRAIRRQVADLPETVDVACGDGTITLELAAAHDDVSFRGIDINTDGVAMAEQRRQELGAQNVTFEVADANDLDFGTIEQVLLLDVLEHVEDDVSLLASAGRAIRPGGRVVVSTPTPEYPRFFGREFHEAVGHVRDGYTLEQMKQMLDDAGFDVTTATHYTRLPSSIACSAFYRSLWKQGRLGIALSPFLNAVSFLDHVWPSSKGASSILVVGIKR